MHLASRTVTPRCFIALFGTLHGNREEEERYTKSNIVTSRYYYRFGGNLLFLKMYHFQFLLQREKAK